MPEEMLSRTLKCLHCGNVAPMRVLERPNTIQSYDVDGEEDDRHQFAWEAGYIYWLLRCFSCSNVTLERQTVHTGIDPEGIEGPFDILYPPQLEQPSGLPTEVAKAYDAALAVRNKDATFFALLLGRVLERVCKDRKAAGKNLYQKIESLALDCNLPSDFVELAHSLRNLRNFAAHDNAEELAAEDAPLLESICRVLLIYLYTAPALVTLATKRRNELLGEKSQN
jgi:hypothetical protein